MTVFTWRFTAFVLCAIGLYFNKPDFEIALLMLVCLAVADIIKAINDQS